MNDTIIALATPQGIGALAIIRISGSNAHAAIIGCVEEKEKLRKTDYWRCGLYLIKDMDEIVDEVSIIKYQAPKSYTGENMAEIICHGGAVIVERIVGSILKAGVRYAEKGEFTRRAFLNGKMDLIKAEAIGAIIHSRNAYEHRNAIIGYRGGYAKKIEKWKNELEELLVQIESEIEFGEEAEEVRGARERIKRIAEKTRKEIERELAIRQGIKSGGEAAEIALIGPPNAGKSSLMNKLLGYDRSLVHKKRGTTRDSVSEEIRIDEHTIRIVDTAGLCEDGDEIEKMGVKKAWESVEKSDLVIWVSAADEKIKKEEKTILEKREKNCIIGFINKTDLADGRSKKVWGETRGIEMTGGSALTGECETLLNKIKERTKKGFLGEGEASIAITERQENALKRVAQKILSIERRQTGEEDIMAMACREALQSLKEFSGEISAEEVMNKIFDNFCIGK